MCVTYRTASCGNAGEDGKCHLLQTDPRDALHRIRRVVARAATNQLHDAAAIDQRDRRTDGHRTDTYTLAGRSGQRQ